MHRYAVDAVVNGKLTDENADLVVEKRVIVDSKNRSSSVDAIVDGGADVPEIVDSIVCAVVAGDMTDGDA